MVAGVYRLWFSKTDSYIGSSQDVTRRVLKHARQCFNRTHKNPKIQQAYDSNGGLWPQIVLICDNNRVLFYEQKCLDLYRPICNRSARASGVVFTPLIVAKVAAGWTPERRAARKAYMIGNKQCVGRKDTPETCEKRSKAMSGRKPSEAARVGARDRMLRLHAERYKGFKNYAKD